jgi:chemotaxis protein MotA
MPQEGGKPGKAGGPARQKARRAPPTIFKEDMANMKSKLDIMTVLGWILAAGVIVVGCTMSTDKTTGSLVVKMDNLPNFYDLTSVIIVLGGTLTALMVSFPISQLLKIPKHLKIMLFPSTYEPAEYINQLVAFAKKARINGLLALEEDLNGIQDAFLKSSMVMVVDSVDPEKVKQQLESRLENLGDRHAQDAAFYSRGAAYAPSFAMMGTMFSLINMLRTLDDPSTIGPNMAIALITTFYGVVIANAILNPIANKLNVRHEEEYLCDLIICEGVQAIQAGENPKFIQERLVNLLPQYMQKGVKTEGEY